MDATPPSTHDRRRRSILVMLVAVALFALMDAGLKTLSGRYPPFQVATLRGAASLPLVLAWSLATVGWRPLLRVRWPLHLLRGAIGVLGPFLLVVLLFASVLWLLRKSAQLWRARRLFTGEIARLSDLTRRD